MLPVVWLLGTSGAGKSTVGYRLLSELADHGVVAAFVDADQLRLAATVPASETQLIAAGLRALLPGYQDAGARLLIVAGLADDQQHLARLLPGLPRERILACHLDADASVIRDRIRQREWLVELTEQAVDYAATIDSALADLRIDTSALSPEDVSKRLADAALAHADHANPVSEIKTAGYSGATDLTTSVVLVTGPGGVGSSTAGFQSYLMLANSAVRVAYLDAHQLGFVGADPRGPRITALRARNTRAMIGSLAACGAQTVIVTGDIATAGRVEDSALRDGLNVTTVALRAAPRTLAARIRRRAHGDGPPIAGDHRRGRTGRALEESISASIEDASGINIHLTNAHPLDTDDADPAEVAASIVEIADRAPKT